MRSHPPNSNSTICQLAPLAVTRAPPGCPPLAPRFAVRTLVILLAFFQALWAFTLIILRFGHPIGVFGIWLVLIGISSVLKVLIGCFFGVFWCFQFSQIHRLLSQRAGLARV